MAVQLVQMVRDAERYPPPHSADIHPDNVGRCLADGWVLVPPPNNDDIPSDFPGALSLQAAGVTQLSQIAGKSEAELLEIKGIKAATARNIVNRLAALSFTDY